MLATAPINSPRRVGRMSQPKQDEQEVAGTGGGSERPAVDVAVQDKRGAPPGEPRRGALKTIVALGTLAYAGALVVPAARFATSTGGESGGRKEARWVRVGRLADL